MNIEELINKVDAEKLRVCSDSRKIKSGDVFVAIEGTQTNGHNFIEQAVNNGAKFVVCENDYCNPNLTVLKVPDTSYVYGKLAQVMFDRPEKQLCNLAITGTNGKTTTAFLVRAIINSTDAKCGLIGTVINDTGNGIVNAEMTTPDAIDLANMQRQMVNSGCKYMVLEASSHAIEQKRLSSINFKSVAFTNLTGDHLDYHKTMENYLAAKSKIFENLNGKSWAILNDDSKQSHDIAKKTAVRKVFYGINKNTDLAATIIKETVSKTEYSLTFEGKTVIINSPLSGRHNVSNHLAAAGLCIAAGFSLEQIKKGLEGLKVVPGRLEAVNCGQNFAVFIDYAHTDDALINVLKTLRPVCKGKLTTVFGCGGDRDRTKRPRMAAAAEQYADNVIVTSDNPRTENPQTIIDEIITGFIDKGKIKVQADREQAIAFAIKKAQKDDIILIAGKGHEDYQIIGKEKRHFSDKETAEKYLKELL